MRKIQRRYRAGWGRERSRRNSTNFDFVSETAITTKCRHEKLTRVSGSALADCHDIWSKTCYRFQKQFQLQFPLASAFRMDCPQQRPRHFKNCHHPRPFWHSWNIIIPNPFLKFYDVPTWSISKYWIIEIYGYICPSAVVNKYEF